MRAGGFMNKIDPLVLAQLIVRGSYINFKYNAGTFYILMFNYLKFLYE